MPGEPVVDVIIPVLNGGAELDTCLARVYAQQGVRVRVVVADNGSDDGTPTRAAAAGAVVVHEAQRSSYAARNRALREVAADWVAFTDADCEPEPTWLANAVAVLGGTGADLVGGRVRHHEAHSLPGRLDAIQYLDQEAHVAGGFGATANLVVRRKVLDALGGFDAARQSGGDLEFGLRAKDAGFRIAYAPDAVVWHHPRDSWSGVLHKAWRVSTAQGRMLAKGELAPRPWLLSPQMYLPPQRVRREGLALVLTHLVVTACGLLGRLVGILMELRDRRR